MTPKTASELCKTSQKPIKCSSSNLIISTLLTLSCSSLNVSFKWSLPVWISVSPFFIFCSCEWWNTWFYFFPWWKVSFPLRLPKLSWLKLLSIFLAYSFNLKLYESVLLKQSNRFNKCSIWIHSRKKRKVSLETRAELPILRTYAENQAMLEPIFLYRPSKCKRTKEKGNEDCLWTHIFTFLYDYCQLFFFFLSRCKQNKIKLCYNRLQFVKETYYLTLLSFLTFLTYFYKMLKMLLQWKMYI